MQRKKLPRLLRRAFAGLAAVVTAALFFGSAQPISALPAPTASPGPSTSPTPIPRGTNVLPAGSSLLFVLDDRISSKYARSGDSVRAHLRDTLALGGMTVAAAGTPVRIKIADVRAARSPDIDGSVDIFFEAVTLANQASLPLTAPTSHLTITMSAGQASTAGVEDTVKDIFIPYHFLYRMFRKGSNLELGAGTVIRARTAATVDASKTGTVSIIAPPPVNLSADPPHADYKPNPFYTVPPKPTQAPKPTPTPSPSAQPSTEPAPIPTPSPSGGK